MKALRSLAVLFPIFIFLSCASQQAAVTARDKRIDELEAELKRLATDEVARGDLGIWKTEDSLLVSVKDSVLFEPDSAVLRPESAGLLRRLAEVFKGAPERVVRVQGNTAVALSDPGVAALYPTSWHLGAIRAANVVQFLQGECGMDPLQLVVVSLGQYRPRADNATVEGKTRNRRVDFVLVRRALYEMPQW